MSSRSCKSKRMNAMQLLSFQSNLYSQTDIQPQRALQIATSSHISENGSKGKIDEREAILSVVKGLRGDELCATPLSRSKTVKRCLTRGKSFIRKGKGEEIAKSESPKDNYILNTHEATMPINDSITISGWTVTPLRNDNHTIGRCPSTKTKNIRTTNEEAKVDFLAPLRYSTKYGRSAWRFVLPSPDHKKEAVFTNDLPDWFQGTNEEIKVYLGPKSSSPSNSSTFSISTSERYSSDETTDLESSISSIAKIKGHGRSISHTSYAEPSFSGAAPLPCQLPIPSFLARR